jgi:RNA polymerase sigma factor (sigma-70 family)
MTSMPTRTTTESRTDLDPAEAAALLIAVQRGRDGALDDLVRLCEPFVRRCAQRYAWRRADADDIVQEVWVRVMLKADQIRDPRTLIAWLQIVTRRVAARLGHREARQVPTELCDRRSSEGSVEDDALRRHDQDEAARVVNHALDRLPEHDRTLLLLLHRDDRPGYDDISRTVRRPIGSLGPSRRRLLDRLGKDVQIARLRALPAAS